MDHARQNCFIVGAASKAGRAIAQHYIIQGANVVIADPLLARAQKIAADLLPGLSDRLLPVQLDIADKEGLQAVFKMVAGNCGKINVFVLASEIEIACELGDAPFDVWKPYLSRYLKTARFALKTCLPYMDTSGRGRVVVLEPPPVQGYSSFKPAYNLAKHGLARTVNVMAREGKNSGVAVTLVRPRPNFLTVRWQQALSVSEKPARPVVPNAGTNIVAGDRRFASEGQAEIERFLRLFR